MGQLCEADLVELQIEIEEGGAIVELDGLTQSLFLILINDDTKYCVCPLLSNRPEQEVFGRI